MAELYPPQVLLMTFSGLVNRHQADVVAYLIEEHRGLRQLRLMGLEPTTFSLGSGTEETRIAGTAEDGRGQPALAQEVELFGEDDWNLW